MKRGQDRDIGNRLKRLEALGKTFRRRLSKDGRPSRYRFENERFDSSWELAFWIFNRDNGICIHRCKECFEYSSDGKTYKYYPDFEINKELVEIKGDQFFDNEGNLINPYDRTQDQRCREKQLCMKHNGVKVLKRDDIVPYIHYVEEKYGDGFMDQFKIIS